MMIYNLPDGDAVHHYKKSIVILFAGKRHVISTGPNNGGYREDLQAVFNHDDNPGPGMACVMRDDTYEGHMNVVALEDLGLNPEKCSGLCTAASMENVSIKTMTYRELAVTAIVTAGIEHNGGRAGDPAAYYEENETFYDLSGQDSGDQPENLSGTSAADETMPVIPDPCTSASGTTPGTINVLLHINAALDAGTLARTIMTATEAKAAALQELMVRSHNSSGLATGSGTDGIITICNPRSSLKLTNAGKNSKLGELIGKTVMEATKEALHKQSGLCPERQRDVMRIMGKYGIDEDTLWEEYQNGLRKRSDSQKRSSVDVRKIRCDDFQKSGMEEKAECFGKGMSKADFIDRLDCLKVSPEMVNLTFLYVHVLDLLSWGLIGPGEAEQMAERLLPDGYLQDKCPKGREGLKEKYIKFLLGCVDERKCLKL